MLQVGFVFWSYQQICILERELWPLWSVDRKGQEWRQQRVKSLGLSWVGQQMPFLSIGVSRLTLGQRRASPGSPSLLLPEGPAGGRGSEARCGPAWVVSCPAPTRGAVA